MTTNVDFSQMYLSELARHESELTLLVTMSIGVVALIFAIGIFLIFRENRSIIRTAHGHIKELESKRQTIDKWYDDKKCSLDTYLKEEFRKFNLQIEEIRCFQTLVMALENTGTHAAIIFPALCVLAERPCALYVGVFRELIKLNITPDITERAELGLRNWQAIQSKAGDNGQKVI